MHSKTFDDVEVSKVFCISYIKYIMTDELFVVGKKVSKGDGYEVLIANTEKYCSKVHHLARGAELTLKYHIRKTKSWYVASGQFDYKWIDTSNANMKSRILNVGDIVTIEIGQPHHLICLKDGDVFESGTPEINNDSYYLLKESANNKKYKHLVLLMHMGLGDHILMTPAVDELSKQVGKLYIPCKTMYQDALKCIYGHVKNLELLPITSTADERIIGSELERVLNELRTKLGGEISIAATGMYNTNPNPLFPFPSGFYKDVGMDFLTCRKGFKWNNTQTSPLLEILKQLKLQHAFVHDVSSTKTGDRISGDVFAAAGAAECIALNPDRNMYATSHPFYYLAQLAVRKPSQNVPSVSYSKETEGNAVVVQCWHSTVLDYISLIESAHALHLIDSCYFAMSAFIDISAVRRKNVYKRENVKYDWLTPELGWNEILL
jgi:mannose-6-phosphate isomerase